MLEEGSNVVEQMSNDEVNRQDANMSWIQISEPAKEFLTAFCLHLSGRHFAPPGTFGLFHFSEYYQCLPVAHTHRRAPKQQGMSAEASPAERVAIGISFGNSYSSIAFTSAVSAYFMYLPTGNV